MNHRWCQNRSLSVLFILTLNNCSLILRSLYSVGNSSVVKAFNGSCKLNPFCGAQRGFRTGHLRRDAFPYHCYSKRACRKTNRRKMSLILLLVNTLRCEYTSMFFSQILSFLKQVCRRKPYSFSRIDLFIAFKKHHWFMNQDWKNWAETK